MLAAVHLSSDVFLKCLVLFFLFLFLIRSSIESEPALVLGPLRSVEEQRLEQQLQEIELRRQERERRAAEEDSGARDDSPPIQEKADELTGPFHYEFSYWARSEPLHVHYVFSLFSSASDDGPLAQTVINILRHCKVRWC